MALEKIGGEESKKEVVKVGRERSSDLIERRREKGRVRRREVYLDTAPP